MRRLLSLAVSAIVISGCGSGLYDFPTQAGTTEACAALIDALPDSVGGQETTPVDSARMAAWGDPRIVLRCGVTRPSALTPTSRCDEVDGVGWFAERTDDGRRFTTIGRLPDVSVDVPDDVQPAADALIDLAPAITKITQVIDGCQ